jgi:peptidyl carrier protein
MALAALFSKETDDMSVLDRIEQHIERHHLAGNAEGLDADTPLFDLNIIDSSGIFDIVQFISDEFDVQVPFEKVTPQNFRSIRVIAELVERSAPRKMRV